MPIVCRAAEMRELDRQTIEEARVPGLLLMETAGRAVATECLSLLAANQVAASAQGRATSAPAGRGEVLILCGPGNNGGDGLVVARVLTAQGLAVRVLCASDPAGLRGDAARMLEQLAASEVVVPIERAPASGAGAWLQARLLSASLIVDALLGTGLDRPVSGTLGELIACCNDHRRCPLVAIDLASGLACDTGRVLGAALRADVTVTFHALKPAHLLHPGAQLSGRVRVAEIGIPPARAARLPVFGRYLDGADLAGYLPPRRPDSHKGDFGHVLVVGGSPGKAGAPTLAALGALRAGAGLVSVVAEERVLAQAHALPPEAMTVPLASWSLPGPGDPAGRGPAAVLPVPLGPGQVLAIGPGWGGLERPDAAQRVAWLTALLAAGRPAVLDADALNLLAAHPALLALAAPAAPGPAGTGVAAGRCSLVLTPHPGEMARLTGRTVAELQADRIGAALALAAARGAVVLLKGQGSVVAAPDGRYTLVAAGNPGLAKGGSGDLLTGVIAALLAQGLDPYDAAAVGASLHGLAADLVCQRLAEEALLASDVAIALGTVMRGLPR